MIRPAHLPFPDTSCAEPNLRCSLVLALGKGKTEYHEDIEVRCTQALYSCLSRFLSGSCVHVEVTPTAVPPVIRPPHDDGSDQDYLLPNTVYSGYT